jgi:hypothetical protein
MQTRVCWDLAYSTSYNSWLGGSPVCVGRPAVLIGAMRTTNCNFALQLSGPYFLKQRHISYIVPPVDTHVQ